MLRRSVTGWSAPGAVRVAFVVALLTVTTGPSAAYAVPERTDAGAGAVSAPTGGTQARWPWPVAPPIVVARAFEAPPTPYAAGHRGIDLTTAPGAEVRSPADGVVTFSGIVVDRSVLTIDVGGDLLVSFEPIVGVGTRADSVAKGELLGRVAEGGHCGSHCLHVGVRLRGAYISPMLFFDRVPRAVLLPLE